MSIKPRMIDWDVTWNSVSLGTVYEVDPNLTLILEEIMRGTTGKAVLGHMVCGLTGTVKVECADVDSTLINSMLPWDATNHGLTPATPNTDLYTYAQLLTLHPHDLPTATTNEDLNLVKAVPNRPLPLKRDGKTQDKLIIEFNIYPDRAKLVLATPVLYYGFNGPVV